MFSRNGQSSAASREKPQEQSPAESNGYDSQYAALPNHRQDTIVPVPKHKGWIPIRPAGESGRWGFNPWMFIKLVWKSSSTLSQWVNILWPVVPAAIVYWGILRAHAEAEGEDVWGSRVCFALLYVAMVPCANLIGFAGQELARKMPHHIGVYVEITMGSVVEVIMFMVLLKNNTIAPSVIKAAILGSILATMLLCLGACFFAGGIRRDDVTFDGTISEVGAGLLLISGVGLAIPTIFFYAVSWSGSNLTVEEQTNLTNLARHNATDLSRMVAILLMLAFVVYVIFQLHTHHSLFDAVYEADEERNDDRHEVKHKEKLTLTECLVALVCAIALVAIIAFALVTQIEHIVEQGHVSDAFMGLILVPLVEKAAEHLTAIDEAWDNQANLALSHCIGATIQTAMFNGPLVVLVAWGRGFEMDFIFEIFDVVMLILGIIAVGNFLRDGKSDYLEGFCCLTVYVAFAGAAWYFPGTTASAEA